MRPRAALLVLCAYGCDAKTTPRSIAPTVRAESVELIDGDTVLRASAAQTVFSDDAGVSLRGVQVERGAMTLRAATAEGAPQGAWSLLGGVHGWFSGALTQVVAPHADASSEPRVELDAARMRLDPRTRTATLEGAVRIRRGDVTIESARVIVRYGAGGEVLSADASGPVTAHTAGGALVAPLGARADFVQRVLVLLGRVRVTQGGAVIEGDGVRVDLTTGAVELQSVRGWLPGR